MSDDGKKVLDVTLTLFDAAEGANDRLPSPTRRKVVPPSVQTVTSIQLVVDQLREMEAGRVELKRLPELAGHWGCTYIGLEVGKSRASHTEVHPEPTLPERIQAAQAEFYRQQAFLNGIGAEARTREWASQHKWFFLEGAVAWLKGTQTEAVAALNSSDVAISAALPSCSQALEPKVASRMRWENVKALVRVQEQQRQAEKNANIRKACVEMQQRCASEEMLSMVLLDVAASTLPELPWRGEGVVDIPWNLGLTPKIAKCRDEPLAASVGGGITLGVQSIQTTKRRDSLENAPRLQLCYYCAGGLGGSHRPVSSRVEIASDCS